MLKTRNVKQKHVARDRHLVLNGKQPLYCLSHREAGMLTRDIKMKGVRNVQYLVCNGKVFVLLKSSTIC